MRQQMNTHLALVLQHLREQPVQPPPPPWQQIGVAAVAGLWEVGYAPQSDYLLVISSTGRGVFDCLTGVRVARDRTEPARQSHWYDEVTLQGEGIGPLAGQSIRLAGLHGGGLPLITRDGWSLTFLAPDWPWGCMLLQYPGRSIYQGTEHGTKMFEDYEPRAFGFSETGRSFVIATGSDITLFARGG
jgi:hypothetical protein